MYEEYLLPTVIDMQTDLLISSSERTFSSTTPFQDNSSRHANLLNVLGREQIIKLNLSKDDSNINMRVWTNKKTKVDAEAISKALQNLEHESKVGKCKVEGVRRSVLGGGDRFETEEYFRIQEFILSTSCDQELSNV